MNNQREAPQSAPSKDDLPLSVLAVIILICGSGIYLGWYMKNERRLRAQQLMQEEAERNALSLQQQEALQRESRSNMLQAQSQVHPQPIPNPMPAIPYQPPPPVHPSR